MTTVIPKSCAMASNTSGWRVCSGCRDCMHVPPVQLPPSPVRHALGYEPHRCRLAGCSSTRKHLAVQLWTTQCRCRSTYQQQVLPQGEKAASCGNAGWHTILASDPGEDKFRTSEWLLTSSVAVGSGASPVAGEVQTPTVTCSSGMVMSGGVARCN